MCSSRTLTSGEAVEQPPKWAGERTFRVPDATLSSWMEEAKRTTSAASMIELLFERAGVGLALFSPDGTLLRANEEWRRATALAAQDRPGIVDVLAGTRDAALEMLRRAGAGEHLEIPRHERIVGGHRSWWVGSVDPVALDEGTGLLFSLRRLESAFRGERGEVVYVHQEQEAVAEGLRTRSGELEADVLRRAQELREVDPQLRAANQQIEDLDRERERRAEEARQSEAKYRSLFESIDEGFCIVEVLFEGEKPVDYRFLDANPAFERHTGLRDAVGRRMRELAPAHEEHWFRIYGEVARTGEAVRFENPANALGRFYDVYAFRVGAPLERRVAILFNDITERKRAEGRLKELNARLVEADRRKDEFLGMLSHELRNPLAPIRNALWILDRAEPTGQQARRAKDVASRQVAHLTRLVDDLLDVTRIARGKIELRRADVDLAALASRTAEDHRALMLDRGLQLTVEVPRAPVMVNGDETRLAQVLGNLLNNAAKFTRAGGRVTLGLSPEGGSAEIRVRDTGAGIEPGLLETMFEPFTQGTQTLARSEGGLGLGLALVKGLVALHGGDVTAASGGSGRGTEVVVTIPLVPRSVGDDRREDEPPLRAMARRHVLVVDDNRDAAETLAQLIELLGHEAEVTHDGASAIARARARPPDVVLCDIGLPGMDGFAVARTLRAGGPAGLRIYAVSGYAQPGDVASAQAAGFDGHLAKPLAPEELARILA